MTGRNGDRIKLATVWLGGCSGCHMSFLDLDEWLFELAMFADVVFTPLVDIKEYPEHVDAVLVEGAVANEDNLEFIRLVRERSKWLISFGDCAVTGNVTALRNPLGDPLTILERSYIELADVNPRLPDEPDILPPLLDRVEPLHRVVHVDAYIPGCPPPADRIRKSLEAIRDGRLPKLEGQDIQFG
ncbi:NADH-quinone oxidoreductase subunit B family protein [Thalassoroseus pseudoceratinae]|uniref:NADH-quinone oxidoreductase subunit B family protein n=1 Tax=Thalassoroseus pseudoceratinae TaxID=2713176 RepID=UPI0014228927|nr:oxidoreductase [Thalassoroseus pseudoceratinae]